MKMPTVTPILNYRNRKNKCSTYPIHLRITLNRASIYLPIPTPQNISVQDWNVKSKGEIYIKNSHPFAFEINQKIIELKNRANEVIKRHYLQNK